MEAGALVLADTGVWCIDEFAKMRNEDKGSIHEAMEQQTISVAKGGMVCKVNTRTTIIAACNQIQNKRHIEDLSKSTGIISSLLSRFDLIYLIPDLHDKDEDIAKADYWLFRNSIDFKSNPNLWSPNKIGKYIKFVKTLFDPVLTDQAEEIFKSYFLYIKSSPRVGKERQTVRMIESMIRLGQAHARLMFRDEITTFDAISVVVLLESTLYSGLIKATDIHVRYSSKRDYLELKLQILKKLKLTSDYHQKLLLETSKQDVEWSIETPIAVRKYIQEIEVANELQNDLISDEYSFFDDIITFPGGFNITQLNLQWKTPHLHPIEEEKLINTSQQLPSLSFNDLDEEKWDDILDQLLSKVYL